MMHAQAQLAFVQVPLLQPTASAATGDIRIEVQRGALRVAVSWPRRGRCAVHRLAA
jgi:hypothetical protein